MSYVCRENVRKCADDVSNGVVRPDTFVDNEKQGEAETEIALSGTVRFPFSKQQSAQLAHISVLILFFSSFLPAACLCSVACHSLAGLVVVTNKQMAHSIDLSNAFTFASGALLAASFLHIIPEAMEGLAGEGVSLHDMGLDAGLSILVGLFLSICIRAMLETGDTEGVVGVIEAEKAPGTGRPSGTPSSTPR